MIWRSAVATTSLWYWPWMFFCANSLLNVGLVPSGGAHLAELAGAGPVVSVLKIGRAVGGVTELRNERAELLDEVLAAEVAGGDVQRDLLVVAAVRD